MLKHLKRSPGLRPLVMLAWLAGASAYADVIYLKSGKIILTERAWVEGDAVKYQTPEGGVKTLSRAGVEDIVHEAASKEAVSKTGFARVATEPKGPAAQGPTLPKSKNKSVLLKSPARETSKEISGETIAQLKKKLAEEPNNATRRAELVTALNLRTGLLLLRGEAEEALSTSQEALSHSPADVPALTNLAVIHFEKGAYRNAEETLRRVELLGGGRNPTVHYLLGEAYYAQDKVQAAIESWRRALQIEPDKGIQERLDRALKEVKTHEHLENQATRHFILRYDRAVADARLGRTILDHLETAYRELSRTLLSTPPETITVILYPDRAYFDITRAPEWSGASYDGKIRLPVKGITQLSESLRATLNHELAHAFIALAVGNRCPTWLNEGIAQQVEGRRARQFGPLLAEARQKKTLLPLEQISRSFTSLSTEQTELAYAQALSAVEYLQRRGGAAAVREILGHLRARRSFGEALGEVLHLGPKDFERAWIGSLEEVRYPSF